MPCSEPESIDFSDDNEEEATENRGSEFNHTYVEDFGSEDPSSTSGETGENDMRILIATDIHVGYGENKGVIHDDSVNTFEEILQIAAKEQVDFILLGGDLFHENNPSRDIMCKTVRLLRKYCLNDNPVYIEFKSDPSVNFNHSTFTRVNYDDCNLNVGLPIFTIHGNHDDMAGMGLTALDELHESGLVNLFGKFEQVEEMTVSPILLTKGTTRLALYGVGSQRDDRLNRAFEKKKINFLRFGAEAEEWFNLLVLHQNRPPRSTSRSTGNYLPVKYIPSFFDVVLWGHEHECKITPEYVDVSAKMDGDGFFIIQPGSSIATSLTPEEALPKHVSVLTIRGRKFQSRPIKLETVRQLIVKTIVLDKTPPKTSLPYPGTREEDMYDEILVIETVKELIKKAKETRGARQPALPLIRINLVYAGVWEHVKVYGGRPLWTMFADQVANPTTMLLTKKMKQKKEKEKARVNEFDFSVFDKSTTCIEDMVSEVLSFVDFDHRLTVLTDDVLKHALRTYTRDQTSVTAANKKLDDLLNHKVRREREREKEREREREKLQKVTMDGMEKEIDNEVKKMKEMFYSAISEENRQKSRANPDEMF
ncbi:hypothetical protein PFISCL1PPCAC_10516, partial [Pristionchus fissidentatus]